MNFIKSFIYAILTVSLSLPESLYGLGVGVIKEQKHQNDSSAKAFLFDEVKDGGQVYNFTKNGEKFSVEKSKAIWMVEIYEKIPLNIASESEISSFRDKLKEVKDFSERFEKAGTVLANHLESLNKVSNKLDEGFVRNNGSWILRAEYEKMIADSENAAKQQLENKLKEINDKRAARIAFENEQKAKGLVQYGGEWVTVEEANSRSKSDNEKLEVNKLIDGKSVFNAVINIFQALDDGALCEVISGTSKTHYPRFSYIRDVALTADGEYYRDDLYYSGTYTYTTVSGQKKTIVEYSISRETAEKKIRILLGYDNPDDKTTLDPDPSPKNDITENISPILKDAQYFGSGFFVGTEGHIITNYHVIENSTELWIHFKDEKITASVVAVSRVADIAILKIEKKVDGLKLSAVDGESGKDIYALGFPQPHIQGTELKVTKGVLSSLSGLNNNKAQYQIDASIQPGNSGGPVCAEDGSVLGIVVSKLDEIANVAAGRSLPQNVNYAIKSSEVLALMRSHGIEPNSAFNINSLEKAKQLVCLVLSK